MEYQGICYHWIPSSPPKVNFVCVQYELWQDQSYTLVKCLNMTCRGSRCYCKKGLYSVTYILMPDTWFLRNELYNPWSSRRGERKSYVDSGGFRSRGSFGSLPLFHRALWIMTLENQPWILLFIYRVSQSNREVISESLQGFVAILLFK